MSRVKVIVDVHLNENEASFRVVIRNDAGRALIAAVKKVEGNRSPTLGEAGAEIETRSKFGASSY